MGPRPRGRGIIATRESATVGTLLQWGRDRAVAELGALGLGAVEANRLQWGRDRAVAELRSFPLGLWRPARASMGPRPRGRGILVNAYAPSGLIVLQWGRDRAVAELIHGVGVRPRAPQASMGPRPRGRGIYSNWSRCSPPRLASMGPRPRGRGIKCRDYYLFRVLLRFNGAATARSRNCERSLQISVLSHSFNGAATARSRNWTLAEPMLSDADALQWGRDRAVAELPSPAGTRRGRTRFNGAATARSRNWYSRR